MLRLDKKASGMVVHAPDRDDADYPLKEWDLITRIGDHEIDNVGMVKVNDDLRLRFQYLIQKLAKDGKVPLTVVREGKPMADRAAGRATSTPMLIESLRGRYPSVLRLRPAGLLARDRASSSPAFDRAGGRSARPWPSSAARW